LDEHIECSLCNGYIPSYTLMCRPLPEEAVADTFLAKGQMPVRKNAWSVKYLISIPTSPDLTSETLLNGVLRQISVARSRQIQACSYQRFDHLDTQSFKKVLALPVRTRMFAPLFALMQPVGFKSHSQAGFRCFKKTSAGLLYEFCHSGRGS